MTQLVAALVAAAGLLTLWVGLASPMTLTWTDPAPGAPGGWDLERARVTPSLGSPIWGVLVDMVPRTTLTYVDPSAEVGVEYCWRIRARRPSVLTPLPIPADYIPDAPAASLWSAPVCAVAQATPPPGDAPAPPTNLILVPLP